jgi:tRNA-dihydrouridine synthase
MPIKIKDEYKNEPVGFNGSGKALGERSDIELVMLLEMAERNPNLFRYFDDLPNDDEIAEIRSKGASKSKLEHHRSLLSQRREQMQKTQPQQTGIANKITNKDAG